MFLARKVLSVVGKSGKNKDLQVYLDIGSNTSMAWPARKYFLNEQTSRSFIVFACTECVLLRVA